MDTSKFQAGDEVRLRLAQEELDGIVLESPDSSIILLKLESGYNIGISKENILAGRIIKKYSPESKENTESKPSINGNPGLPSLGLIITGGTIASKLDSKTGGVKHIISIDEFSKFYPEIFKMVNIKSIELPFMVASESMSSEHWIKIAETAKKMLDDPDIKGIVITHGTDFLSYTSAALSFFFPKLSKPIVLTYSQRSVDRASSDAHLNLQCAARMALDNAGEVMLVGHSSINDDFCFALKGTKVRKMHSSRRDAFQPINTLPIAKVWPDKVEYLSSYNPRSSGKSEIDTSYSDKIALVKFYPGQSPDILDFYALKYKGIIVEASGLGHLPVSETSHNWIPAIKKHIRNGFIICAAAQTIYGRLDPLVYSNGRELLDAGVIFLEDMLPETALVKLGFVLGHFGWKKNIKEKMLENLAGELNPKLSFSVQKFS